MLQLVLQPAGRRGCSCGPNLEGFNFEDRTFEGVILIHQALKRSGDQFIRLETQGPCECEQDAERCLSLSALDAPDEGPIDACLEGQIFLAEAGMQACFGEHLPEGVDQLLISCA